MRAFLDRCGGLAGSIRVHEHTTEEIAAGKKKFFARGAQLSTGQGAKARLEENYLFDTRRFASGALAAGEYIFFASAIGQPAVNNGFPAGMVMSDVETNMDTPSQIPQGKNFVLVQIGISFNTQATAGDIGTLLDSGALRFEKQGGQYTLKHGPGRFWPRGQGLMGFAGTTVATGAANNGIADIRAARRLAVPRVLEQRDQFAYKYVVPRGVSNLDFSTALTLSEPTVMTVWLWGGQEDAIPT